MSVWDMAQRKGAGGAQTGNSGRTRASPGAPRPRALENKTCEQETREEWLNWAVDILREEFARRGYLLPANIRVSLGWTRNRRELAKTYDPDHSSAGATEIFVSPVIDGALEVLDVLTHECCHAAVGVKSGHRKAFQEAARALGLEGKPRYMRGFKSPAWLAWAEPAAAKLGKFPHDAMIAKLEREEKQSTRQLKAECASCGGILRITRKRVDEITANGTQLRCVDPGCDGNLIIELKKGKQEKSEKPGEPDGKEIGHENG